MSFLPNSNFTMGEVDLLAQAAQAAYAGNPLPDGWTVVTPAQLGLAAGYQDGNYFRADLFGSASAIVLRHNNQYILSFRGTDHITTDGPYYPELFFKLLESSLICP